MSEYDDRQWSSRQFTSYAGDQEALLDSEMAAADVSIKSLRVFKDQSINERLIDEADAAGRGSRLPERKLHLLRTDPGAIAALRGSLLDSKRDAKTAARELAVRLEARAEMRSTQGKYGDLWKQADAAERLPKGEEAERLEGLRNERAYADAARDSRRIEFRDAMERLRSEAGDPRDPDRSDDIWRRAR